MSIVLIDKVEHLVIVAAAIAALTVLTIWGHLDVNVAAPAIISLAGVSSAAAVTQAVRSQPTVTEAPPSGGSQTMGAQS